MGRDGASQTHWEQTLQVLSLAGDEILSAPWKALSDPSQNLLLSLALTGSCHLHYSSSLSWRKGKDLCLDLTRSLLSLYPHCLVGGGPVT